MAYDLHVLGQAAIYFVIVIFGFVVAVPLGLTVVEFDNQCILYTQFNWVNGSFATYDLSNNMICNFPVLTAVFTCILYSFVVGLYFSYAACRSNDSNVGYQMWVMPFLLANALVLILMFISCCIMSVGIRNTCESIMKGNDKGSKLKSCADAQNMDWNKAHKTDYNTAHFYTYAKTSESAGWITFLIWIAQMALGILRFFRNRKQRSKDMGYEEYNDEPRKPSRGNSDLEHFASVNPSA